MLASVLIAPTLWMALCVCATSSSGSDNGSKASSYCYALILMFTNRAMFQPLVGFVYSFSEAGRILRLFWCLVICTASLALVLLQGTYQTGDFYTDHQVCMLVSSHLKILSSMLTSRLRCTHFLWS
eukprot:TRINITY_DN16638_c0_g1_i1.p1 TRINITY_DN16638_c0_g1~~TRINITY_DN16638_c0_g1_i1.p1  ORF type:complete len:126 (+),score=11.45 TRINITY_DN16638_c0_g1_i1:135-512(+)